MQLISTACFALVWLKKSERAFWLVARLSASGGRQAVFFAGLGDPEVYPRNNGCFSGNGYGSKLNHQELDRRF